MRHLIEKNLLTKSFITEKSSDRFALILDKILSKTDLKKLFSSVEGNQFTFNVTSIFLKETYIAMMKRNVSRKGEQ